MGAQFSDINTVAKNQYLNKLVDAEHLNENDPFWNQLLAFNLRLAFNVENSKLLDESIALLCQTFFQNNPTSLNYASLIKNFCKRANQIKEMSDNNSVVLETKNALLLIRCFTKYLIEIDTEDVFLTNLTVKSEQTENNSDNNSNDPNQLCPSENILNEFVTTLLELCINLPVESHTYYLHLEALNTIIVLLTIQLFEKKPIHESLIFDIFMTKIDHLVSDFVKTLLNNIIQQIPNPDINGNGNRGLISSVASGLWSVMTLGYSSSSPSTSSGQSSSSNTNVSLTPPNDSNQIENIDCHSRSLALQSCHVLLILSNHCTNELFRNPYRLALFHFTDTLDAPTTIPNLEPLAWFSIDYTKLYNIFCLTMNNDQYTLLLYMLLHRNQHFKMFILSRVNIDCLIVPILRVIYSASERNSHHIYMALIILLILSEDDLFNKSIHSIQIKKLTWYTERSINEISLGGLVVLVVIRAIQYNMTRMRDKYLHTNCLATLANMSSKFHSLHPYVCQRINSLFNLLAKKQTKIYVLINEEDDTSEAAGSDDSKQDYMQDLAILEELMRMVLEIINSCLSNTIHHNGNLVYSILYNKSSFMQFKDHPSFQDIFQNIELVANHFSKEVENLEDKSVEKLKEIIEQGIKQFPRDRLKKFPELKFKYVEEDQPEEFFVPYVWSLVNQSSGLYWIDRTINLFPTVNNSTTSAATS